MMTIGFMPGKNMLTWEPERLCDCVREAGYDSIELQASLLCGGDKTPMYRERFMRAVERSGLTVSEAVLQRDFVLMDESARVAQMKGVIRDMNIMADLGIGVFNMFSGPCPWAERPVVVERDVRLGRAWQWIFEAYDRLVPEAERLHVRIAVENVWGMIVHNMYTNRYLQSRYDSEALGINLDPSHDVLDGIRDMDFLVRAWGIEKIHHVHLKDAAGTQDGYRFIFPLLGEGEVDWKAFFGALENIGYQGACSVEFESWNYLTNILDDQYERAAALCRDAVSKLMKKN